MCPSTAELNYSGNEESRCSSHALATVQLALAGLLLSAAVAQASPIFSLLPQSGAISGAPGSTIGWGYTIANDTGLWLEVTGLTADPFQHATADASPFDFPILAPFTTLRVPYNPAAFAGLFQITWDPTAPAGFTNAGVFTLSSAFWDADPLAGGNFLAFAQDQTASYTATVVASVPEANALLLTMSALAAAGMLRPRGRRCADRRRP